MVLFRPCACGEKIAFKDEHDLCMFCLAQTSHYSEDCEFCESFNDKTVRTRRALVALGPPVKAKKRPTQKKPTQKKVSPLKLKVMSRPAPKPSAPQEEHSSSPLSAISVYSEEATTAPEVSPLRRAKKRKQGELEDSNDSSGRRRHLKPTPPPRTEGPASAPARERALPPSAASHPPSGPSKSAPCLSTLGPTLVPALASPRPSSATVGRSSASATTLIKKPAQAPSAPETASAATAPSFGAAISMTPLTANTTKKKTEQRTSTPQHGAKKSDSGADRSGAEGKNKNE